MQFGKNNIRVTKDHDNNRITISEEQVCDASNSTISFGGQSFAPCTVTLGRVVYEGPLKPCEPPQFPRLAEPTE